MIEHYYNIAISHGKEFEYFKTNIFPITMKLEGGGKLHNVSGDSGGWTIYGIAYNYNKNEFKNFEDFKDTTFDEACAIAFIRYYLPVKADKVRVSEKLDLFDMAYNLGVSQTIRQIQKYYGLHEDGVIGAITLSKLQNITSQDIYKIRTSYYYRLVQAKSLLSKFLKGWTNRANYILSQK